MGNEWRMRFDAHMFEDSTFFKIRGGAYPWDHRFIAIRDVLLGLIVKRMVSYSFDLVLRNSFCIDQNSWGSPSALSFSAYGGSVSTIRLEKVICSSCFVLFLLLQRSFILHVGDYSIDFVTHLLLFREVDLYISHIPRGWKLIFIAPLGTVDQLYFATISLSI